MNVHIKGKNRGRTAGRRLSLLTALLTGFLAAGQAGAQIPVTDVASIAKQVFTSLERALEHVETIKKWKQQFDNFEKELTKFTTMLKLNGIDIRQDLKPRGLTDGVELACPSVAELPSFTEVFNILSLDENAEITKQQEKICVKIQMARNIRYNEMIKVLERIEKRAQDLEALKRKQETMSDDPGAMAGAMNNMSSFMSQTQIDMQYSQSVIESYDIYIASLQDDQRKLAKAAMRGKKTILGTVAQGLVLEGALQGLRSRDR